MPEVTRIEKWVNQSDVDYYAHFIKAWIAFNAWYRENNPTLDNDRAIINKLKKEGNHFKSAIVSLLSNEDENCKLFRNEVANLHTTLNRAQISFFHPENPDYVILCSEVCIEKNPNLYCPQDMNKNKITYHVQAYEKPEANKPKYVITIKSANNTLFCCNEMRVFSSAKLKQRLETSKCSPNQKATILSLYEKINPWYPTSILFNSNEEHEDEKTLCGEISFSSDKNKIASGLIEILYLLRNKLMHGELDPTKETLLVYKSAYNILLPTIKLLL
jgi:hypothetical protein